MASTLTAKEAMIKNIHDPNVKILTVLDTTEDGLPSHVLVRRLDEGVWYEGAHTEKAYQVPALAIGVTLGGMAYGDQKESDWLIGFTIKRGWLLTIAWCCFVEAMRGWLRQLTHGREEET